MNDPTTLGELEKAVKSLLEEYDRDTDIVVDANGVILTGADMKYDKENDRVVIY